MKKIFLLISILIFGTLLSACHKKDPNTIYIGATPTPHAEILEFARPLLLEKGYKLDIKIETDYVLPNKAVSNGSLDANYFQHTQYLNQYNADNKTNLVSVGGVHFEPIGIYTKNLTLKDITTWNGTTVVLSNSVTDQLRILKLLEKSGLITLKQDASIVDNVSDVIESNPYHLTFEDNIDASFLTTNFNQLKETDNKVIAINTNFVLDAKIDNSYRILSEAPSDAANYVNVIVVKKGHEDESKIQALIEVLQSDEVKHFIEEKYLGAVVSAQ